MSTEVKFEDGNLIVSRVFKAPRESVFQAWVETSQVERWWGCAECTAVKSEIEPKVGGKYNHHMTIDGPAGSGEVAGLAVLTQFDPPTRLAYTSADKDDPYGADMVVSVDFTEVDGGTLVRLVHAGIPDMLVPGDITLREIIRQGWSAAFGKLDQFLTA